jgi:hypothetical protein
MKAVLEISSDDLNKNLIDVLTALFNQNISEVVIRKTKIQLEEFDKTLTVENVMQSLKEHGHNDLLLMDIEKGLRNSSLNERQ